MNYIAPSGVFAIILSILTGIGLISLIFNWNSVLASTAILISEASSTIIPYVILILVIGIIIRRIIFGLTRPFY